MKRLYTLYILLLCCFVLQAEEGVHERVFVHTDKNCYVAGEDIFVKFLAIDTYFQPSTLSKVGYVEICDTERPQIQLKLALKTGSGAGKITIPPQIPTGIYQLTGYTRYMRNEGEKVFFKRQIIIINVGAQTEADRMEIVETEALPKPVRETSNIRVTTDRNEYANRSQIQLSLFDLPENITDLVVSVSRDDSIAYLPEMNKQEWIKQVKNSSPIPQSPQWLPEYEGHIVSGQIIPKPEIAEDLIPNVSFVGKDIRYVNGQIVSNDGLTDFYTTGVYGRQQVVASVISNLYEKTPYRLDIISPFHSFLPEKLPLLPVRLHEEKMMERYIGAQLREFTATDTLYNQIPPEGYYHLSVPLTYDLNEYTRFPTLSETIFEFVSWVRVSKIGNQRRIRVFLPEEQRYNSGNTLVLLDGIPVYDHELLLNYNPYLIRKIYIYSGRFTFNGETFGSIVSFVTHQANLPSFQLSEESQLFEYECPLLPDAFEMPDYSKPEIKNSRQPDFRHTLYWNPFVTPTETGKPVQLSFYSSDLKGAFDIVVEGITSDGELIHGTTRFTVK